MLVDGRSFPDALAAGAAAETVNGSPIFPSRLASGTTFPDALAEHLRAMGARCADSVVYGGPGAVSHAVVAVVGAAST